MLNSSAAAGGLPASCRFIPGPNCIRAAAAVAVLALLPLWAPGAENAVYTAAGIALLAGLADFLGLRRACGQIGVTRTYPATVGRDVPFTVNLQITSTLPYPAVLQLRDVLPPAAVPGIHTALIALPAVKPALSPDSAPAAAAVNHEYSLRIPVRGDYALGGVYGRLTGRLGFLTLQWMAAPAVKIKVFPECIADPGEFGRFRSAALSGKRQQIRQRGEGMEFLAITQFQFGDAVRRIDWRASARRQQLLVRRHQIEQHREMLILLDCGRLMGVDIGAGSKLDQAVNSAMMLCNVAFLRGDKCGLGVYDDCTRVFLPPQASLEQGLVVENLYNVQSSFRETDFQPLFSLLQARQRKRALLVVLSDLSDAAASTRYRAALTVLARSHLVIFAALRTPQLAERLQAPLDTWEDVVEKAVVFQLERERETTLHTLARNGIKIIDVTPAELAAPLINTYLDIRETGRL